MNKKQTKRQRDIKTKLMAAICMLMVSSIMMVSTTYAWFTLSTAPEVTGITTSVGANGNLEMALLPTNGDTNGITSGVGDSDKDLKDRNLTWGNLVNLAYSEVGKTENYYGLDKIVLYPAALSTPTKENGGVDDYGNPLKFTTSAPLSIPLYGADGRVSSLSPNTLTSTYDSTAGNFPNNESYGVRAIGTSSGMTARQLDYRNARGQAETMRGAAQSTATTSLANNGTTLTNIVLKYAIDGDNASFTVEDLKALQTILDSLIGTDGAFGKIDQAYANYLFAMAASNATTQEGAEDVIYNTAKSFQNEGNKTANDWLTWWNGIVSQYSITDTGVTGQLTTIGEYLSKLNESVGTAQTANSSLQTLIDSGKDSFTWAEINSALSTLIDTNKINLNDMTVSEAKNNIAKLMGGVELQITTGGGVYADIADHTGDYARSFELGEGASYEGMSLAGMPVTIDVKTKIGVAEDAPEGTKGTPYLTTMANAVLAMGAPASAAGNMPMTDYYGYIIDLAFRTNADDSDLLLQVEAANRIYEKDTNGVTVETDKHGAESTMGNGSTMTFTTTSLTFTAEQMASLMEAIRIVFFDPDQGTVYATAMLDMEDYTLGEDGATITAKMFLYELGNNDTAYTKYEKATEEDITAAQQPNATVKLYKKVTTDTYTEVTADELTDATAESGYYVAAETVAAGSVVNRLDDAVITEMSAGQAKKVSVLVYLDGAYVTNADVAADASTSMSGTMNLQFASSANLVPMNYTPLQYQNNAADATTTEATETSEAAGN